MPASHLALVVLTCLVWGGNFLLSAIGVRHFPPLLFTALRMAVILVALAPFLRLPPRGSRRLATVIAVVNGVLHFGFNLAGLKLAGDISSVAVVLQCYIPMSALFAGVLLGERLRVGTLVGVGTAFVGVLVLGFDPLVLDAPWALVLTLASASMLALGTTLSRTLRGMSAFQMQAWTAVVCLPILLGASAALEGNPLPFVTSAEPLAWCGVLYSAILSSVLGHGLLFWLVQRHPVSQVTPYLLMTPLFATTLGVLVWGDRPGPRLLAGGALVLAGVLAVTLAPRPAPVSGLVREQ